MLRRPGRQNLGPSGKAVIAGSDFSPCVRSPPRGWPEWQNGAELVPEMQSLLSRIRAVRESSSQSVERTA